MPSPVRNQPSAAAASSPNNQPSNAASPSATHTLPIPQVATATDPSQAELSPPQRHINVATSRTPNSANMLTTSTLTPSIRGPPSTETPAKRPRNDAPPEYSSPSPNKHAPDFDVLPSSNNSLHSSDDPNDWEAEELRVEQAIEKDNGMRWL